MSHCSSLVRAYFRSLRSTIRVVSPPFGEEPWSSQGGKQLGSSLYVGCRHCSLNCTRAAAEARPNNSSTRFSKNSSFISLQRTQEAMEYYCESLHHKKYHVSSIHTIPSKNIAFIQVMFDALQYRSFTFGEATDSKQNAYIIGRFEV